jgi:YVTN family beta-propeller protein
MVIYGDTLYVANEGSGTVSAIDMTTNTVIPPPIAVGTNPNTMVIYGDRLYVANEGSGTVSAIDTLTNTLTFTFTVGTNPGDMVIYGDRLFVTNQGSATVSAIGLSTIVCYLEGTKILTKNGYKAIEDIHVDDMVVTKGTIRDSTFVKHPQQNVPVWKNALSRQTNKATLTLSSVVWIGNFTANVNHDDSRPICIKAHTFGQNKPFEDLYVSSGHRIITPAGFYTASKLVNGTTIVRDYSRKQVKYYHIELKEHSAIIANGLEAESYQDVKNLRRTFGYQPKKTK